jgi:hypothetical protein
MQMMYGVTVLALVCAVEKENVHVAPTPSSTRCEDP